MNSAKTITAKFLRSEIFLLNVTTTGTGRGTFTQSPDLEEYIEGSIVTLTAHAEDSSIFVGWNGDANSKDDSLIITLDSTKNIIAEFSELNLPDFGIKVTLDSAELQNLEEQDESFIFYISISNNCEIPVQFNLPISNYVTSYGDVVEQDFWVAGLIDDETISTLTPGQSSSTGLWFSLSKINEISTGDCLHFYVEQTAPLRCLKFIFRCTDPGLFAFKLIDAVALDVITTGSGVGSIERNYGTENGSQGSIVTLTAEAEEGSIFNGWQGDASGMDTRCTLAMDSAKRVTADFLKLDVPDLGIEVRFDSVEAAHMKNGEDALILYFSVANNEPKQVRVELPLASYVTAQGEEIEQSAWLSSLLMGNKGSTLRAGTFRKMGLVFYKSGLAKVTLGNDVHITVLQAKPARRLGFTFRCTDQELRQFSLIKTVATLTQALDENGETSLEKLEILQRLTLLEDAMRAILQRLDALQLAPAPVPTNARLEPIRTLPEVLAWLATQSRISMATLRAQLLPLDLLPNALIDDINERAYDLAGEAALDDDGDAVTVQRDVLLQVLTAWDE